MNRFLPGTKIEAKQGETGVAHLVLGNIFQTGGLALSQVSYLLGVEPHVVQNWVRRGYVSSPVKKMYSRRQFCRLAIINMLKDAFQLERIAALLSYINGALDDESDDSVSDEDLYDYFADMLCLAEGKGVTLAAAAISATGTYKELAEGGRTKVLKTLEVMYYAYKSAVFKKKAESAVTEIM